MQTLALLLLLSPAPASDPPVEFLLDAAATDFRAHQPPEPARFRNVRIGHLPAPDGSTLYLLCGEFQPTPDSGPPVWVAFATIKTDPYEQWLGVQAQAWCGREGTKWEKGDWSMALLERFVARR
jgi:hypothetical protein